MVLGAPSDATGGGDQSDIQPPSAVPVSEDQREEEGGWSWGSEMWEVGVIVICSTLPHQNYFFNISFFIFLILPSSFPPLFQIN